MATGVRVSTIDDACKALTGDEIGPILDAQGIGRSLDGDYIHSAADGSPSSQIVGHGCTYDNGGPVENVATFAELRLIIEPDADGAVFNSYYSDYRTMADKVGRPPLARDEVGIGDQAFSSGGELVYVRWGRWCVTVTIENRRLTSADRLSRLRTLTLLVLPRLPRD